MKTLFSRREFIRAFSVITSVGFLSKYPIFAQSEKTNPKSQETVLVIGAGAAGLGAARVLQSQGYNVRILEGRNRIGGRVWTERSLKGLSLDMGASWIHGIRENPLYSYVQQFNIKTSPTNYENTSSYNSKGKYLSGDQEDKHDALFNRVFQSLNKACKKLIKQGASDISIQQALDDFLKTENLSQEELITLKYLFNTNIEHEYAADISQLSLFHFDRGKGFGGGDVLFPGGYDQIFSRLAEGIEINLGQIVTRIEYNDTEVKVTTNQGVFEATYAIVTVPLGVLKKGSIEFSPLLPKRKLQAISNLGMGLLNKVYLRFPTVFWEKKSDYLEFISPSKGEWAEWVNVYKYTNEPVLLAFNAAKYGRQTEIFSDAKIVDEAMKTLRIMYGASIPSPTSWLISRWASDPFAFGSYSYLTPNATSADYKALAEPVNNRLFFAGEATSSDYAATVHGALLSGEHAAKQITFIRDTIKNRG